MILHIKGVPTYFNLSNILRVQDVADKGEYSAHEINIHDSDLTDFFFESLGSPATGSVICFERNIANYWECIQVDELLHDIEKLSSGTLIRAYSVNDAGPLYDCENFTDPSSLADVGDLELLNVNQIKFAFSFEQNKEWTVVFCGGCEQYLVPFKSEYVFSRLAEN